MILNTSTFQNSIFVWVRDHRLHHKYTDTAADPHNSKNGFFFSHMGWLMLQKHPEVIAKGRTIDLSDLKADPIVMFQHKYYIILMPLLAFVPTIVIPMYLWNESFDVAFCFVTIFRYLIELHFTWTVNSIAHFYGSKPYDR